MRLLGDDTRLRLLRLLSHEALNVSELTAILGVAQSGVSRHLGLLREAGLVAEQRAGTFTVVPARARRGSGGRAARRALELAPRGLRRRHPGIARRRCATGGSAARPSRELRPQRGRRRAAPARAGPELGRVGARARPAAAAARRRRPRLRRGLSHDRDRAMGATRHRRRSIEGRARARPRARGAAQGAQHRLEARRARTRAARRRLGRRRAALAVAAPRGEAGGRARRSASDPAAGRPARCSSISASTIRPG